MMGEIMEVGFYVIEAILIAVWVASAICRRVDKIDASQRLHYALERGDAEVEAVLITYSHLLNKEQVKGAELWIEKRREVKRFIEANLP